MTDDAKLAHGIDATAAPKLADGVEAQAARIGVSPRFLRAAIARGEIPACHLGRRVVITERALIEYLAARETRAGDPDPVSVARIERVL